MNTTVETPPNIRGEELPVHAAHLISVFALGMGLTVFFAITYILCVLGYIFFPNVPIEHSALAALLPGFTLLSWPSFFLGLLESFGWG